MTPPFCDACSIIDNRRIGQTSSGPEEDRRSKRVRLVKKVDPRVARTRRQLRAAVVDLANERDLDLITVSDIASRAEVNRATVYLHCRDRDSLLVEALESWLGEIADMAARSCPARGMETPAELVDMFREFERNATLFTRVLGPNGSGKLTHRMHAVIREHVHARLPRHEEPGGVPHELRAAFLSGALLGVVSQWLDSGLTTPASEVADGTWRLLHNLT